VRLLVEGDHFGEIGIVYKCPRTASIVSRNYNTMAFLSQPGFREITSDFPEFEKAMRKFSHRYNWGRKRFLLDKFQKIEFLKKCHKNAQNEVMFSLKQKYYSVGDIVQAKGEEIERIIIIEKGLLEIFTEFEGNEFIFEFFGEGCTLYK
jgi:CRP-like cAMP-binding protein